MKLKSTSSTWNLLAGSNKAFSLTTDCHLKRTKYLIRKNIGGISRFFLQINSASIFILIANKLDSAPPPPFPPSHPLKTFFKFTHNRRSTFQGLVVNLSQLFLRYLAVIEKVIVQRKKTNWFFCYYYLLRTFSEDNRERGRLTYIAHFLSCINTNVLLDD